MRKLFSVLAVLIFALSFNLTAQITNTASVGFLVKSFKVTNIVGEPLDSATAWFDPDTIGADDLLLTGTVASVIDSLTVTMDFVIRYKQWKGTKTCTVATNTEVWLPDTIWNAQIPDSLFYVWLKHDRPLVVGEKFELSVKPVIQTIVEVGHPVGRLTVKTTIDSLHAGSGAVATDWFPADLSNLTILTMLYTASADTAAQIAVGYQLSWDKITTILPMDDATALHDSTTTVDNDITGRIGRWNYAFFTHPICRWMRLIYFYKSTVGRVAVGQVDVVTGN